MIIFFHFLVHFVYVLDWGEKIKKKKHKKTTSILINYFYDTIFLYHPHTFSASHPVSWYSSFLKTYQQGNSAHSFKRDIIFRDVSNHGSPHLNLLLKIIPASLPLLLLFVFVLPSNQKLSLQIITFQFLCNLF